jgi:aminomethyltransferase
MPQKTQLYEYHEKNGNLTQFAGFTMPLWYDGTVSECLAVRKSVGIFDISHMGRVFVSGADAEKFLNNLTTNNITMVKPDHAQYTLICNRNGGIKDDLVVFKFEEKPYMVIFNAGNREKDFNWFMGNSKNYDVKLHDASNEIAMLSIQGPKAVPTIQKLTETNLSSMIRFDCMYTKIRGQDCILSRTGYTGEDGLEICVLDASVDDPAKALNLWNDILNTGKEFGIKPCGLGSRDVLRLEAGMCLYGNDINESTDPLEANLNFVVKFEKGDFVGKEAILRNKAAGLKRSRIGLSIIGKGIPRAESKILKSGKELGMVTSGTFSPILNGGIAMGYVPLENAGLGEELSIEVHGKLLDAEVVGFPFYDPKLYGLKRVS